MSNLISPTDRWKLARYERETEKCHGGGWGREAATTKEGGTKGKRKPNDYTYSSSASASFARPPLSGRIELIRRKIKYTHSHNYHEPRKFSSERARERELRPSSPPCLPLSALFCPAKNIFIPLLRPRRMNYPLLPSPYHPILPFV